MIDAMHNNLLSRSKSIQDNWSAVLPAVHVLVVADRSAMFAMRLNQHAEHFSDSPGSLSRWSRILCSQLRGKHSEQSPLQAPVEVPYNLAAPAEASCLLSGRCSLRPPVSQPAFYLLTGLHSFRKALVGFLVGMFHKVSPLDFSKII
jgi:hypothetical protein